MLAKRKRGDLLATSASRRGSHRPLLWATQTTHRGDSRATISTSNCPHRQPRPRPSQALCHRVPRQSLNPRSLCQSGARLPISLHGSRATRAAGPTSSLATRHHQPRHRQRHARLLRSPRRLWRQLPLPRWPRARHCRAATLARLALRSPPPSRRTQSLPWPRRAMPLPRAPRQARACTMTTSSPMKAQMLQTTTWGPRQLSTKIIGTNLSSRMTRQSKLEKTSRLQNQSSRLNQSRCTKTSTSLRTSARTMLN
mmetsp:Transcript_6887/g.22154  ORF Transcript_6887/g.22154 Transcript_6887/m.22154 type:complete len:254 (-) Transcript_6887:123-884(-)